MKRLGEYELLKKIGSGGMAEVWMGRRAAMAGASKAVAVKLLARNVLDDPVYRQMFLDEARLSMLLTHSNIVQVFDVGEVGGECFMVMEWVDGLNLSELSRKLGTSGERLPVGVVAHVIGEVLRALSYAHGLHHDGSQATIVHRDVSPHNVLVSVSGEVKLADFGVARLAREETSGLHVKGKLRYMAPEQLRGHSRDPKVDLYAVGAILHELLQGERFRSTRDEVDLYGMVLSGEYPPLTVEVPYEIEQLRQALLDPDPDRRVQSADDGLELLHRWPGYRNHSRAIGKLVREWVGVGAPRSGIVSASMVAAARAETGPSTLSAAATVPADTRPAARGAPSSGSHPPHADSGDNDAETQVETHAHADSGPSGEREVTETRTYVDAESSPAVATSGTGPVRAPVSSMMIVAFMTLAVAFGIFGVGFPLGWWSGGGDEPAPVAAASVAPVAVPVEDAGAEAATSDGSDTTGAPVAAEGPGGDATGDESGGEEASGEGEAETGAGEAETSGDASGDASGDGDGDPITKTTPKTPKAQKPATVTLKAHKWPFVYVKVGGIERVLEPLAEITIKPGKHVVYLRESPDDPWVRAGKLEVESGKSYTVSMTKPAGFTVSK